MIRVFTDFSSCNLLIHDIGDPYYQRRYQENEQYHSENKKKNLIQNSWCHHPKGNVFLDFCFFFHNIFRIFSIACTQFIFILWLLRLLESENALFYKYVFRNILNEIFHLKPINKESIYMIILIFNFSFDINYPTIA